MKYSTNYSRKMRQINYVENRKLKLKSIKNTVKDNLRPYVQENIMRQIVKVNLIRPN